MKKIQTWDNVIVMRGKEGVRWEVSTVLRFVGTEKVIVKGVKMIKKAVKKQWFVEREAPIHISNVMLYCEKEKKPTRVAIKTDKNKKMRYYKKNNEVVLKSK